MKGVTFLVKDHAIFDHLKIASYTRANYWPLSDLQGLASVYVRRCARSCATPTAEPAYMEQTLGAAFALARPATLGTGHTPRCARAARRRPRVRATAAGAQADSSRFSERTLSLSRSALRPGLLGGYDVADEVGAELRMLGANCAADLAFAVLRDGGAIPPLWREALYVAVDAGITAEALDRFIDRIGLRKLISIEPSRARRVVTILNEQMALTKGKTRRALIHAPALLAADEREIQRLLDILLGAGLNQRDIQETFCRWPIMLLAESGKAKQVVDLLKERALRGCLRRFLCRAPYVLLYDVETTMLPAIKWMNWCALDVERVIRSCPMVLGCSTASLDTVKNFILEDVGVEEEKRIKCVLNAFPPLLATSVDDALRPALRFLRVDLGLAREDVANIVRAFPATLTLDVETEMRMNVEYFRGRGIENVCQIVKHLPPILGYDLNKDIIPKMRFFENTLKFSPHEILKFPGYFSYKLHERIIPRTLFIIANDGHLKSSALTVTLSLTDKEFCQRVANRPMKEYQAFQKRLRELRMRSSSRRQYITSQQLKDTHARLETGPTTLRRIVHQVDEPVNTTKIAITQNHT